ncbi:MAG TPA: Ger(x)C family spore germination protein, partial [Bacillus sp. (in: firmicutes)]|nr:Ger(x)C family spore germination protein [Bacillus sp. (in: firmicutes)]
MKSIFLLLFFCGSVFLVSGCWDRVELNDLAIVTAAAIDKKGENEIELSIQVFIPKTLSSGGGQGGGGGSGGGTMTLVTSKKGANLADALSKLQSEIPRKVFWGQCKVFIFGEKLAKEGIQEQMDFLLRHPQPRERAYMFVSEG